MAPGHQGHEGSPSEGLAAPRHHGQQPGLRAPQRCMDGVGQVAAIRQGEGGQDPQPPAVLLGRCKARGGGGLQGVVRGVQGDEGRAGEAQEDAHGPHLRPGLRAADHNLRLLARACEHRAEDPREAGGQGQAERRGGEGDDAHDLGPGQHGRLGLPRLLEQVGHAGGRREVEEEPRVPVHWQVAEGHGAGRRAAHAVDLVPGLVHHHRAGQD
mmetsp:Transcript_101433/g.310167  ORF Transcript_101433/g.310167 Transcript_101433/m.310167 type:complete len:212 (-) Transcript_101433:1176-1811(-)